MKKFLNNKINIYLCISFAVAIVSISLILHYVKNPIKHSLDSENFGRSLKYVTISSTKPLSMYEYLSNISKNNNIIYGNPVSSTIIKGSLEKSMIIYPTIENEPYLFKNREISGDYFNKDYIDKKVAIIGNNMENMCTIDGTKTYIDITFNNEVLKYEVIGTIVKDSYLSNSVFIPYKSIYGTSIGNIKTDMYNFLIPSNSEYNMENSNFNLENISEYSKRSKLKLIIDDFLNMAKNNQNLILCTILCIINVIIFSIFWLRSIRKKISIFKALGANNLYIFRYIFSWIIFIGILGSILGGIIVLVLSRIIYIQEALDIITVIISMISTIVISIISTIFSYIDILKFNIKEYIR